MTCCGVRVVGIHCRTHGPVASVAAAAPWHAGSLEVHNAWPRIRRGRDGVHDSLAFSDSIGYVVGAVALGLAGNGRRWLIIQHGYRAAPRGSAEALMLQASAARACWMIWRVDTPALAGISAHFPRPRSSDRHSAPFGRCTFVSADRAALPMIQFFAVCTSFMAIPLRKEERPCNLLSTAVL